MKKTRLYLDTSVPSFLFADDAPEKKMVTIKFWKLLSEGAFDAAVSWNFQHMVKLKTIRGVNGINKINGYPEIEILTPASWVDEEEDD